MLFSLAVVVEMRQHHCSSLYVNPSISRVDFAPSSCVMRSLGVADRDPEETLFYYEHIKARYEHVNSCTQ